MGLFNKKENSINKRWKDAYEANSSLYRNDKGTIIAACALTEGTDSIFPLDPDKHWGMEGVKIDKWIISIVSITNADVIGQLEYHEGMKLLEPYFLDVRDGWALIGAMTLEQMEGLFDGIPRSVL